MLEPANKDTLADILSCHIVAARVLSGDIMGMIADDGGAHPVGTVGSCRLVARSSDGMITFEDEDGTVATVTQAVWRSPTA